MSAAAKARRAACVCMCHESGPPDLHMAPGQKCPCKPQPPADDGTPATPLFAECHADDVDFLR